MSEWNFMDASSRANVMNAWRRESEGMFALAEEAWEDPTACAGWDCRDVIGHIVDTTEAYFVSFDAARGKVEAPEPLGVKDMAGYVDEGAKAFRDVPQDELLERLRGDRDRMLGIMEELTDEEWSSLLVPHKYMGPLPASFYAIFQLVDYAVHSWDMRQGRSLGHGLQSDSADLLVPLCFILWQSTAEIPPESPPFSVGVRITSGANAGDTRADVSAEGINFEAGSIDDLPTILEFDAGSFVLTAYGRVNGGTTRGDAEPARKFNRLFFRI
jgi:uncharacterized protein (TIGR03083 family)